MMQGAVIEIPDSAPEQRVVDAAAELLIFALRGVEQMALAHVRALRRREEGRRHRDIADMPARQLEALRHEVEIECSQASPRAM